jgi:hypothetical protein
MGSIGVAGCLGFVAFGRARGSRWRCPWRHWYEFSHPSVDRRIARLEVLARQLARPRERAREDWIVSAR